jgi:hypothetical protein
MIKFFFLLFLFPTVLFASEKYAVERPDGGVSIIHYQPSSSEPIEEVIHSLGFDGLPIRKVNDSDIPSERTDRKYWTVLGKKIVVDTATKQADLDAKAQKQAQKEAVLVKLKITQAELEKINGGK